MPHTTTLADLVGIEHCKLGFYQELQQKVEQLKSSNLELERKRTEIQALLDGITDLMVVLSEDMRIQRVNHVFAEWYPGIDPVGRRCWEVFRGTGSVCADCPALRALDRDEIVKDLCVYKLGERFRQFDIIASPLKAGPTGERQVLLFKRDVTLEKEFQAQFYQAEKMATLGTLTAGVAHEINNPLTAINGFAQGLKRRIGRLQGQVDADLYEDFCEYTDTIIKECLRCRDIVRTLLTFSWPTSTSLAQSGPQPVRHRHPVRAQAPAQGTSRRDRAHRPRARTAGHPRGRIPAQAGDHQPAHQRHRRHRRQRRHPHPHRHGDGPGSNWSSRTAAAASRTSCSTGCSSPFSPPSRWARGSASGCPPAMPSSRATTARSV